MTTNKPEVVAWLRNERGEYARGPATFDPMCVFGSREPQGLEASYSPVVRLSEYEALQAECEKLSKDAERYRWLKARLYVVDTYSGKGISYEIGIDGAEVPDIDDPTEAIDAAMQRDNPC